MTVCRYGPPPQAGDAELRARQRQALGLGPHAILFLAAGPCDLNKAFDWAIRELPAVDKRAHLVLVGDGPERRHLARLAADLGVDARTHLTGPQRDMEPWYAAADVVMSTSFYDTYPNTLQEALCRGLPVIAPRHQPPHVFAGFAEVLSAGGGLLYDRTQAGALADGMNRLVRDAALRAGLSGEARVVSQRWLGHGAVLDGLRSGGGQESDGCSEAEEQLP